MTAPLVAVLGGYGAVGRAVADGLRRSGHALRIGGRDPAATERAAAELDAESRPVDLWDDASLADFCLGATVVVNGAGPSYRVLDRVARAALAAGADYVDPGGDQPLVDALGGRAPRTGFAERGGARGGRPPGCVVVNAGLMPGLTAVLPRWLAGRLNTPPVALTAYAGLVDRFTPVGAAEYLLTLGGGHGEAQAVWRGGRKVSQAALPQSEVELPGFPGRVALHPYLSIETERTARDLGLDRVEWWNVFDGSGHVVTALSRLQGAMRGIGLEAAAEELCAAARLDLFGQPPYQRIDVALTDADGNRARLVLHAVDTYAITAAVTVAATERVLTGAVPPGVWFVEEAVDTDDLVRRIRADPSVTRFDTGGDEIADPDAAEVDEGEL